MWQRSAMIYHPVQHLRVQRLLFLTFLPIVIGMVISCIGHKRKLRRARISTPGSPSLERLCQTILGNNKQSVRRAFGPPLASAGFSSIAPAMLVASDSLHADVWYYPLDPTARAAMAVQFDRNIADVVEVVTLPSAFRR